MTKRALIFGITGQDGSYLAEILLARGYEVYGFYRRTSNGNLRRIEHILGNITLIRGDLNDLDSIDWAIRGAQAQEIYNLADQDHVGWSYELPLLAADVTTKAVIQMLETIRKTDTQTRFFQPCSATMFGDAPPPQTEDTPFRPMSPYAVAKAATYHWCQYYRDVHNLNILIGIMFNHDSIRRSGDYLLHNIAKQAVAVKEGNREYVELPELEWKVDIGHAEEFMQSAHRLLELGYNGPWVFSTGIGFTMACLAAAALDTVGLGDNGRIVVSKKQRRPGPQAELVGKSIRTCPDPDAVPGVYCLPPKIHAEKMLREITDYYSRLL